jgi:hypothetical protein
MASQTTNKAIVPCTGGGRLVIATGTAKFVAKKKACTLVLPFTTLDSAALQQIQISVAGSASSYGLYVTKTVFGTKLASYAIRVSRRTGTLSALALCYQLIGH